MASWACIPTSRASRQVSTPDRKSTRLNSSHVETSYAVFCLKKKSYRRLQHKREHSLRLLHGPPQCGLTAEGRSHQIVSFEAELLRGRRHRRVQLRHALCLRF